MGRLENGKKSNQKAVNRRKNVWFGYLGVAAIAVVVVGYSDFLILQHLRFVRRRPGQGVLEDFSFTLFRGKDRLGAEKLEMNQVLGKPIVLNFWAGQ